MDNITCWLLYTALIISIGYSQYLSHADCDNLISLKLKMNDSYGDSWKKDYVRITDIDTYQDIYTFTYECQDYYSCSYEYKNVEYYDLYYCYFQCFEIHCDAIGKYPEDITWQLQDDDQDSYIIHKGNCPYSEVICFCTDGIYYSNISRQDQCPYRVCDNCQKNYCTYVYDDRCCDYECTLCSYGYIIDPYNPQNCILPDPDPDCDNLISLKLKMKDSYGDSWRKDYVRITDIDTYQDIYTFFFECQDYNSCSYEYKNVEYYDLYYCYFQCFEIHCDAIGKYPEDISWQLQDDDQDSYIIHKGNCPYSEVICFCTDGIYYSNISRQDQCPYRVCDNCQKDYCTYVYDDRCCDYECTLCSYGFIIDPQNSKNCIKPKKY